ncbi:hypothetical protein PENANT_c010G09427 [Penicillium antarcticum]|uniref:DUF1279 domain-containing protein n=1 Tax=Penicillium antarcticum TaxID=416450 RepID=A0A1V6Q826_9EURO|nr:uncharacterized protein N7508_000766 [Penicillium antarcticum]KAJ5320483.1 hypothetical protein N7508_000766 [Penicillium antarcticum]OQD85381.1 hypothetical protein PENANT_c010G09427 [Penicillium antarcticum]
MSLRPTLLSKWISRPSEILQRATKNNIYISSTRTYAPRHTSILSQAARRTLATTLGQTSRLTARPRCRAGPNTFQQPKQRLNRRFNSGSAGNGGSQARPEKDSLSQRLKKLSREYGWSALGVYLALSALDFPFCFAAVRLLGVERIGYWEHIAVEFLKDKFKAVWPAVQTGEGEDSPGQLEKAEERNQEEASIWTQLALAYAIHKSFIFIRVPLTAAVTPKVVKTLRGWGWNIGKRKPKST